MISPHALVSQRAAPLCLSIKIVTGVVLLLAAALLVASFYETALALLVCIFALSIWLSYLLSPSEYAIESGSLMVRRHWGVKTFANVVRCSVPEARPRALTLRLFGNGGVFSGTGLFWNRRWGVFRAYVTRAKYHELVLVETAKRKKILISPEDPAAFVRDAGCAYDDRHDTEDTKGTAGMDRAGRGR